MACNCWTHGPQCCMRQYTWVDDKANSMPPHCPDPNHVPGVLYMVIPPAGYEHRCPSCGKVTVIYGTQITN